MNKRIMTIFLAEILVLTLCACGGQSGQPVPNQTTQQEQIVSSEERTPERPAFGDLKWESGMQLYFADRFQIEKSGEYELITIVDSGRFLLVSGDMQIPENLPEDVVVLQKPLNNVYLASSSVFDLIAKTGAMDAVHLSGTKDKDLFIPEAVEALAEGRMLYAGKYSAPDYELLVSEGCKLAIENTMIYHNPEVKEKLESLGIPVLVERSSYETHPLGRMEWIKLYGVLFGKQQEAEQFFQEKLEVLNPLMKQEKTGCKVAFFYVNTNGAINVRKSGDYIPKMIELAGGEYVPEETSEEDENALSTMNMQVEDFYLAARQADVLIYNSTTTGVLNSVEELLEKNPLFGDFEAVKNGRVYCTAKNFFQQTTAIGDLMEDLSKVMRDEEAKDFHQLIHVR